MIHVKNYTFYIVCQIVILSNGIVGGLIDYNVNLSKPIQFLNDKSINCAMYAEDCYFPVQLNLANPFTQGNLQIKSNNTYLLDVISVKKCGTNVQSSTSLISSHACLNVSNNKNIYIIHLDPLVVGKTSLQFILGDNVLAYKHVIIPKPYRFLDIFYEAYVIVFSLLIAFLMGIMLNWEVIKKIIKVPLPVAIGFTSQYIMMPLLSFGYIHLFKLGAAEALALFIYGCSPGGTVSNNWTIIFDGDLDLSAILTFFSTVASLVMLPLWYYTLGQTLSVNANIDIPIDKLVLNLFFAIVPTLLGMVVGHNFPKVKEKVGKVIKHLVVILVLTLFMLTIFTKFYIFGLMKWHLWFTGPLLPWTGFIVGGLLAWVARLPSKQILTVSIETGLQNVGVPFLIIMLNFPSPDADYALLPLVAVTALTGLPLWLALLVKITLHSWKKLFESNTIEKQQIEIENDRFNEKKIFVEGAIDVK